MHEQKARYTRRGDARDAVTTAAVIRDFLAQPTLAVAGVSRQGKKFGNLAYRALRARGYRLFPIHPTAAEVEGERCYPSLAALPEAVGGLLVVLPPAQTEVVVHDAWRAGIRRVWLQQGAESAVAIHACQQNGIQVVHGHCILMFAEPVGGVHRAHRWLWRLIGRLPH